MRWPAPPDRREITLILFSLTVFFLSYNVDASMRLLGFDPEATHGVISSSLGLGSSNVIGQDGRKLPGWRDTLEQDIFGSWGWDEGHVAGDGAERSQLKGTGRHGAMWAGKQETGALGGKNFGDTTVNEALRRWGDDVPRTKVVRHVTGYTILDNVFIFNGTVFIVTDDRELFPSLSSIVATTGPGTNSWKIISTGQAKIILGEYGGVLGGVSWMSADNVYHNSTLISLWRTYSSLDPFIDASGRTTLPPPHRLFFPQARVFTDPDPLPHFHWIPRRRVDTGFQPYLVKAAFPHLTIMYLEDWEDYHKFEVPFIIERIVVADRRAAEKETHLGQPVFSAPFELEASQYWWEPVRMTLASYFGALGEEKAAKKVVTYLHRQGEKTGLRLSNEDHKSLMQALKKMERRYGYKVHVVSSRTEETGWNQKMEAIVKSTIVLGAYGNSLLDIVFMKQSPQATFMEFFPPDTFARDAELVLHSRGIHYVAWWHDQSFALDNLPPVAQPDDQEIRIDADAVVKAIHESLSR